MLVDLRSLTLNSSVSSQQAVFDTVIQLFRQMLASFASSSRPVADAPLAGHEATNSAEYLSSDDLIVQDLRGIGIQMSRLTPIGVTPANNAAAKSIFQPANAKQQPNEASSKISFVEDAAVVNNTKHVEKRSRSYHDRSDSASDSDSSDRPLSPSFVDPAEVHDPPALSTNEMAEEKRSKLAESVFNSFNSHRIRSEASVPRSTNNKQVEITSIPSAMPGFVSESQVGAEADECTI